MNEPEPHNNSEQELLSYLRIMRDMRQRKLPAEFKYAGFEDFLLQHGTFFTPSPLPGSIRPMMLSQCFENCFRVASRTKSFHYVEGVALGIIPIHHAFLVDRDGNAYDPTWTAERLGAAYIGVELDLKQVKKSRRNGQLALSDDYRRGFPVLRGENVISPEAWFKR